MNSLPPGPKEPPIAGSVQRYSSDPFSFITALTRSYQGVSTFTLGTERTYLVPNPDDIEKVLVSDNSKYKKPEVIQSGGIGDLLGDGLLLGDGDRWQQQRSLAQPAFAPNRIMGFGDTISDYAQELTDSWQDESPIEIDIEMARATIKIIVSVMFGTEITEEQTNGLQENIEPIVRMFEPNPTQFLLPDWVPTPSRREFDSAVANIDSVLDELVAQHQSGSDDDMDMVSILQRAQRDKGLSSETLKDELMTILLAGHDTTALSLTYSFYLLSKHPEVEQKFHKELENVLDDSPPTAADIRQLNYTENIIQEAMRLYPPVYCTFREPTQQVTLGGYSIPSGSLVMLPQWGVHRDPRWYDQPDEFDPGRWDSERAAKRPTYSYFPFGGGPRHCIGKHLAMVEAQLILATVGQEYRLEKTDDRPVELHPSLTVRPRDPLRMTPRKR